MARILLVSATAVAIAGCHYHRDTNAPGHIDVTVPPRDITSEAMEYPGDPGERMVMLSTGVLAGGGGRSKSPQGIGDFAIEATLSWGEEPRSHNDKDARLFIPPGMRWPNNADGVTLGWSALRLAGSPEGTGTDAFTGPIYAEYQHNRFPWGAGGGWAINPANGDHGPQINFTLVGMFIRTRYMFTDGLEFHLGYMIKIPNTWVWSR